MSSKMSGPGLYEFLIEAELQQYYNAIKNELKVITILVSLNIGYEIQIMLIYLCVWNHGSGSECLTSEICYG
jgi:hypothetical protein